MSKEDNFEVNLEPNVMKIDGLSKLPGGDFEYDIHTNGLVNITKSLTCDYLQVNGLIRCKEDLHVRGDMSCNGLTRIKGILQVDQNADLNGKTTVFGEFYSDGIITIGGSFKGKDKITAMRGFKGDGNIKCRGTLFSKGDIKIKGRLKAEGDVIANNLIIRSESSKDVKIPFNKIASKIEGSIITTQDVYLEKTSVEGTVQGVNITIEKECEILGPIFYVESINIHPTSKVHQTPKQVSLDQI